MTELRLDTYYREHQEGLQQVSNLIGSLASRPEAFVVQRDGDGLLLGDNPPTAQYIQDRYPQIPDLASDVAAIWTINMTYAAQSRIDGLEVVRPQLLHRTGVPALSELEVMRESLLTATARDRYLGIGGGSRHVGLTKTELLTGHSATMHCLDLSLISDQAERSYRLALIELGGVVVHAANLPTTELFEPTAEPRPALAENTAEPTIQPAGRYDGSGGLDAAINDAALTHISWHGGRFVDELNNTLYNRASDQGAEPAVGAIPGLPTAAGLNEVAGYLHTLGAAN